MAEVSVLVEGGKASAGAPLGPALGPLGVNIAEIVNQINEKTRGFAGMKVPVKVKIDSNKNVEIEVGSPPVSGLIKAELKLEKAAKNPKEERVGDLSIEQVIKIAKMKLSNLASKDLKNAAKEVCGTAYSMGVTVNGRKPNQVIKEINEGRFDDFFKQD